MQLKLGKLPARPDAIKFKFTNYFIPKQLPTPPAAFNRHELYKRWGMFANDQYGNCVWAGAAHEEMAWHKEVKSRAVFTDKNILSDYSAATGFDPEKPETDVGTDMQEAASYRRKIGIIDSKSNRHQIESYVSIKLGDLAQLKLAMWLLGSVGVGLRYPDSAMSQFSKCVPWDVIEGANFIGGHYVTALGWLPNNNIAVVTWGKVQEMTPAFYLKYADEVVAYLSKSRMKKSFCMVSPEGFNIERLETDLQSLKN